MFGNRIKLFKLFGFEIRIDLSWLILAFLITFTLAQGFFPYHIKGLSKETYWWMGGAGALGLFASIIFHELCHSLVARRYGLSMRGITLFIFGGVSEMEDQPQNAKTEFLMAIAGPLSSIFLGFGFYGIHILITDYGLDYNLSKPIGSVVEYLSYINFILAGFNLIPAFPLDGGRVLRSALWKWKGNLRWATRIAAGIGSAFGIALIIIGIISIFQGNFIGGIWFFLIGIFLRNASQMSYQQVLIRKILDGRTVRYFMKADPICISPSISIDHLVEDYFYKLHFKTFPVVENKNLIGYIDIARIKHIPREQRGQHNVLEFTQECSSDNTVSPTTDILKALSKMKQTGNNKLMVVEDGKLVGIIALKDVLHFFSTKLELEEYENE